jgi:hypothetical protein
MQFNPKIGFVLGILVTIEIAVSSGTLSLTHAIPADWIPTVTAWSGILAFIGSTVLTFLHGYSSGELGPLVTLPLDRDVLQRQNAQGIARGGLTQPPKLQVLILLAAGFVLLLAVSASAQVPRRQPTGNPIVDIGNAIKGEQQQSTAARNTSTEDLVAKLGKLALPDFEFALAMSKATNNVVSTPCWQAWVDLLSAQQKPLLGTDGKPLTEPDPHLATSVEMISELLAALRPDSTLSTGCAALAAAGGKDAATLIQGILGGGALGLFKLPIPIGPIP